MLTLAVTNESAMKAVPTVRTRGAAARPPPNLRQPIGQLFLDQMDEQAKLDRAERARLIEDQSAPVVEEKASGNDPLSS